MSLSPGAVSCVGHNGGMCRNIRPLNNFEPPATSAEVYDAALQPFVRAKRDQRKKWKSKTINHALSVVRRILNLAARSWRDQHGNTWLATPC